MFKFLEGLDRDLRETLLRQIRDLWTHTSTSIEGNTLSLGDTQFILDEGLTVSGKPIKDHQEVIGHARAIEIIYSLVHKTLSEQNLLDLHKAIQTEVVSDIYKPAGAWKVEPNGTYAVDEQGRQVFIEYAAPAAVPKLMAELIDCTNHICSVGTDFDHAPAVYAKVHMGIAHIHPFWDGNGRIARLVANLPLLKSGLPPIVINKSDRREYIETLSHYQRTIGQLDTTTGVWPDEAALNPFVEFCRRSYASTLSLVEATRKQQEKRREAFD
jgi:Fic family protein